MIKKTSLEAAAQGLPPRISYHVINCLALKYEQPSMNQRDNYTSNFSENPATIWFLSCLQSKIKGVHGQGKSWLVQKN